MINNKNKNFANNYSSGIYTKTKKYQKIYGFDIGKGEHDTWNNEADAFKHTFGSADMALKSNLGISEGIGLFHEYTAKNNPPQEENMDLWNNYQGSEIAKEIRNKYNRVEVFNLIKNGKIDDIIAQKVMQKMKNEELITTPKDNRSFEKLKQGSVTGYAADIPDGKVFTAEEIGKLTSDEFQLNEQYINNQLKEFGVPREYQAKQAIQEGSMVWVDDYVRDDGTEVSGYYRRR